MKPRTLRRTSTGRRGVDTLESVFHQLRELGKRGDPSAPAYDELRTRAVAVFRRTMRNTPRSEAMAIEQFEVFRRSPQLIPGSAPGATPLRQRGAAER